MIRLANKFESVVAYYCQLINCACRNVLYNVLQPMARRFNHPGLHIKKIAWAVYFSTLTGKKTKF